MQTQIEDLLKETMGLNSASVGAPAIESAIRLRMAILGITHMEQYWKSVRASEGELQELIENVVVPETWFFRDEEAFAALARLMTEQWLRSHSFGTLRMLSWPCCTGEEPYSMVMSLLDAGFAPERLHVDAVDISLRALRRARANFYGNNSFRSVGIGYRDRYFARSSQGYALPQWIRDTVSFHYGNLLTTHFDPGVATYDVIFCRNVLIYFDAPTQASVLRRLASLLAPGGLLFVGPAEAFLAASNGYKSLNEPMSFAFIKEIAPIAEAPGVPSLIRTIISPDQSVIAPAARATISRKYMRTLRRRWT